MAVAAVDMVAVDYASNKGPVVSYVLRMMTDDVRDCARPASGCFSDPTIIQP